MEAIRTTDTTRPVRIRDLLERIVEDKKKTAQVEDTKAKTKLWKFPGSWRSKMNKANKRPDMVLVFFLNIKGEIEQPLITPLYSGNMVIIRNKVYEVDPRAFWIIKAGSKVNKLLIFKEIDRRPVSNLDYYEIRKRGDSTDSDEYLLKAFLKATPTSAPKAPFNKTILIILGVLVIGAVIYFLSKAG
jgi:hypothetical protein